jgi:polyisoprenoid-binding protein YceI
VAGIAGTHDLGPTAGRVIVKTGRVGLAARVGHDLTIEITQWSARVTVPGAPDGDIAAASVTAELDLGSLAVREGTGGAKALTDRDRGDIQNTARRILGASATGTFTSSRVILHTEGSTATETSGAIEGTLTLHGTAQPIRLQVTSPAPGRYQGSARLRQTDFGIPPYSGFFGALKLRDEVTVEFEIDLPL